MSGYVNVDIRPDVKPDVLWDLEDFPYPWEDNSVNEIFTSHTVEHVSYRLQNQMMDEFFRIMKCGGTLIITCPDLLMLFEQYSKQTANVGPFGHPHLFMEHFIFGGQDYPENYHKAGYTVESMRWRLERAGFKVIRITPGLRAEAVKP